MPTTWFITGTSSGFGRLLTEQLLERGDRVAATLRRPEALDDLRAQHGDRLRVARLDVTDTAEVHQGVDEAFAALGAIDVVVNNAGYGVFASVEEATDEQIRQVVETNLIGSIHVVRRAAAPARAGARTDPAGLDRRWPDHLPGLRLLPRLEVGDRGLLRDDRAGDRPVRYQPDHRRARRDTHRVRQRPGRRAGDGGLREHPGGGGTAPGRRGCLPQSE